MYRQNWALAVLEADDNCRCVRKERREAAARLRPAPIFAWARACWVSAGLAVFVCGCLTGAAEPQGQANQPSIAQPEVPRAGRDEPAHLVEARKRMVENQLQARDIRDPRVLEAMRRVPRHLFVPETLRPQAYADHPLPIGHGQTISQPYIVALMTQLARPTAKSRALEVGTGSGYQAAVLAEVCGQVYSIEIVEPLAKTARERLAELGYKNVTVRCGDGYQGWREHAPFDLIVATAAPEQVPQPLVEQLAKGGRLVIPIGRFYQELLVLEKQADGSVRREAVTAVRFVPMTGEAQQNRDD